MYVGVHIGYNGQPKRRDDLSRQPHMDGGGDDVDDDGQPA